MQGTLLWYEDHKLLSNNGVGNNVNLLTSKRMENRSQTFRSIPSIEYFHGNIKYI